MSEHVSGLELSVEELSDAWIYVFGRYLVIRQEHIDLAEDGVDYNVLKHNPPVLAGVQAGRGADVREPEPRRRVLRGVDRCRRAHPRDP